jgi:hypothetical protein
MSCTDGRDPVGSDGAGVEQQAAETGGFADYSKRAARYLEGTAEVPEAGPLEWIAIAEMAIRGDEAAFERLDDMTMEDFERSFEKIDDYEDTADFDLLYLMNLRIGYPEQIEPDVSRAIDERILGFKYWYTDSTPDVIDNRWYWSENHRIIFHTLELLAGEMFPDRTFEVRDGDGEEMTGEDHIERASEFIDEWIDEKAEFGFSEWHSNVYYQKDLTPLLTLVEYAQDSEIAARAATVVDLLLFDLAVHQVHANVGVTQGRTYAKDKLNARAQGTFGALQVLFGLSEESPRLGDAGAVLFSRAERYKLPAALWEVAHSDDQFEDIEHMSVAIDPEEPVVADPERSDGLSYTDPDMVPFWWERGALTPWQTVPLTMATADRYDLWETELFSQFSALEEVSDGNPDAAVEIASSFAPLINIGLLSAVDTRTWRDDDVMLSSAVDYRPGRFGHQYHAWQATVDENAIVFTTSPGNEPREGERWEDADLYWNGGVQPRSLQVGPAAVHVYNPVYPSPGPGLLEAFSYLPMTHAYVPTEAFDEAVQLPVPPATEPQGSWLFARVGERYVGLWSWRETAWRDHSADGTPTGGLTEPFDLVAAGGADNVWAVEVGRKGAGEGRYEDFDAFQAALLSATPRVAQGPPGADGLPGALSVLYPSPGVGVLGVAPNGSLSLDGEPVELDETVRFDNPFTRAEVGDTRYEIDAGDNSLRIDLENGDRDVT